MKEEGVLIGLPLEDVFCGGGSPRPLHSTSASYAMQYLWTPFSLTPGGGAERIKGN